MSTEDKLSPNWGAHVGFSIATETRPFDMVENAVKPIQDLHESPLLQRPSAQTAISRAVNALMRTCAASIDFPRDSKYASWDETVPLYKTVNGKRLIVGTTTIPKTGRNHNFSLKITQVKAARVGNETTWRFNIADRRNQVENMGHVLNLTYDTGNLHFNPGSDAAAVNNFGVDVGALIMTEYDKYLNNYNDEDIRAVFNAEMTAMKALKILKKTNCFIANSQVERAKLLYKFAQDTKQEISWLGLDSEIITRDSLLKDLQASIFADMDDFEAKLEVKLNTPTKERKRGEDQRVRMYNTATETIDGILALAEYYEMVLQASAEGIKERAKQLRSKATELLTKDFDIIPINVPVVSIEQVREVVAKIPAQEFVDNVNDPFAAV